jgi:hypothetical protein
VTPAEKLALAAPDPYSVRPAARNASPSLGQAESASGLAGVTKLNVRLVEAHGDRVILSSSCLHAARDDAL